MLSKHLEKYTGGHLKRADVVVKAWNSTMEFFSNMWDGTKEAFRMRHMDERSTWKCTDWVKNK